MKTNKSLDELKKYTDTSRLDINARVQMIIDEVQKQMKKWEDEARKIYFVKPVEIDKGFSASTPNPYDDIPLE